VSTESSRPPDTSEERSQPETQPQNKIELRDLRKAFERPDGSQFVVLEGVNLSVEDRAFVAIIGPSGSGKSTFLFLIAGLDSPTSGAVLVDGEEVRGPGRERGVVFQEDAIFPWRTVLRNVEYGLELQRVPKGERRETARHYLKMVGLDKFEDLYPRQLSGGMKKRVAIAEVLANQPEVLLLDEPFGALDYVTKLSLQEEIALIWERDQVTAVLVTHDIEEAVFLSDRVYVLRDGDLRFEVEVPFSRPRKHELRNSIEFIELKETLWREIGHEEPT
jgi:NitT/TauT family transport system ATP-binding protein